MTGLVEGGDSQASDPPSPERKHARHGDHQARDGNPPRGAQEVFDGHRHAASLAAGGRLVQAAPGSVVDRGSKEAFNEVEAKVTCRKTREVPGTPTVVSF